MHVSNIQLKGQEAHRYKGNDVKGSCHCSSDVPSMCQDMALFSILISALFCFSLEGTDFSFGLHSPDSFPTDLASSLAASATKQLLLAARTDKKFLTDADLIDLTTLPPPLTPDDEKFLLSSIPPGTQKKSHISIDRFAIVCEYLRHVLSEWERDQLDSKLSPFLFPVAENGAGAV